MRWVKSVLRVFQRPHPFDFEAKTAVISGVVVFLFLLLFDPLKFQRREVLDHFMMCSGFGFITSFSIWVNYPLFARLFPKQFNEDGWTVFSEIWYSVYVIIFIGLLNGLFIATLGGKWSEFWKLLLRVELNTFLIAIVPILIVIMIEQNRSLKRKLEQANLLTEGLAKKDDLHVNSITHVFVNEAGKSEIQLQLQQIIFIKAEGNYTEIFFETGDKISKHLIRTRLKVVATQLPQQFFFHAHRSFVINGNRLEKINGNARNYSVSLRGWPKEVPVARNKGNEFMAFVSALNEPIHPA